jgi:hypothetical protein
MWFWLVNEMIGLTSGMPEPQFGDESSLSVKIRASSWFSVFCLKIAGFFICGTLSDERMGL